jgi:hypothetical protein
MSSNDLALSFESVPLSNGCTLDSAMDSNGRVSFRIVVPGGNEDPGCSDCATHERLGRLPAEFRERIFPLPRCGAPTAGGGPCRVQVPEFGGRCRHHTDVAEREDA